MNKKLFGWISWILILAGILFAAAAFSFCTGSAGISLKKILYLFFEGKNSTEYSILFDIRLPRIILAFSIGGALALAGVILQGIFRNPLVEPYTLGISGGAALGVCLNIVFGLQRLFGIMSLPFSGFLGAVSVVIVIYSLAARKGMMRIQGLLLCGVMVGFISSSLVMLLMSVSRAEDLHGIIFWVMGSLEEPSWFLIKISFLAAVLGLVISYLFCFDLNALSLGEEEARHLGINTERTKRLLFVLASLLTGLSVSVAGIIGFIGLVIPHFVRMFIGRDHRMLLAASFLSGGIFLILCDTLARTIISPLELPVGVITGIFGGSIFIFILSRKENAL
jgi:iron complex transport system permease protein